ncbi:MAG: tyrosine-type recombinase/integrase [Candidatus Humimicrobiaceae bacterium]
MDNNIIKVKANIEQAININSFIDKFIASQDIRPSSRDTYRKALKQFAVWASDRPINTLTREDILQYKDFMKAKKLSSYTLSSYLVSVRKFFEWAESLKIYPNIARGVKGGKQNRQFKKDPLTISQIKNLLGSIDRKTDKGKRDFSILNLLIRTGIRTIEIIRADIGDIRQESGEAVLWIQGKGADDKDNFVMLTEDTLRPIREYLSTRKDAKENDPLFTSLSNRNQVERLTTKSISRMVKEDLRGIGLNSGRLTAHSLRHTAITLSLMAGASIQEAQALARHKDINTTLIYSHNLNRVANAPEKKIEILLAGI